MELKFEREREVLAMLYAELLKPDSKEEAKEASEQIKKVVEDQKFLLTSTKLAQAKVRDMFKK